MGKKVIGLKMTKQHRPHKKIFGTLITATLLILLTAGIASAHKIIVFAYKEGDTVFVESKFSGGKKVKNGRISVLDSAGNKILSGKTDDQGRFSFSNTGNEALNIIVYAGTGHQNNWILPADEAGDSDRIENKNASEAVSAEGLTKEGAVPCDAAKIEKVLDRKLEPIMKKLDRLEARQRRPSITDILGGIGYILGLVGIVTFMRNRRKENNDG